MAFLKVSTLTGAPDMTSPKNTSDETSQTEGKPDGSMRPCIDIWQIDQMSVGLMDEPLKFLFAEHQRQRQASFILDAIAGGAFDDDGVRNLVKFLDQDFVDHVADEEIIFFPLLKKQCQPEDKIEDLLSRLADEHREDELVGDHVVDSLRNLLSGRQLTASDKKRLTIFAKHIRQHLAIENAILLPIARVRIDTDSLMFVSEMLKERRAR